MLILVVGLAGNKCDLFEQEEVSEDEARALAKSYNAEFKLISACSGDGVDDFFQQLVEKYEERKSTKLPNEKEEDDSYEREKSFGVNDVNQQKAKKSPCCKG